MVVSTILNVFKSSFKLSWLVVYSVIVSLMIYASFHVMYLPPSQHLLNVYLNYRWDFSYYFLYFFKRKQFVYSFKHILKEKNLFEGHCQDIFALSNELLKAREKWHIMYPLMDINQCHKFIFPLLFSRNKYYIFARYLVTSYDFLSNH